MQSCFVRQITDGFLREADRILGLIGKVDVGPAREGGRRGITALVQRRANARLELT